MAITPVEIIALLTAIAVLAKVIVAAVNKKKGIELIEKMYMRNICLIVYAVLAIVVFYFLIQEVNIVQIFAVFAFVALLGAFGVMAYKKETLDFAKKVMKKGISWLVFVLMIVFVVLAVWAIYEILISVGLI